MFGEKQNINICKYKDVLLFSSQRSNTTTPDHVVNQIYTTHNDDLFTTADQAMTNHLPSIHNGDV